MSLLLYEGGWKKTLLKNKETRAQLGDRETTLQRKQG
jgi:hypothetical protein